MNPNSSDPNNPNLQQPDLSSFPPTPQAPSDATASPPSPEPLPSSPVSPTADSFSTPTSLPDLTSAAQTPPPQPEPIPTFTSGVPLDTISPPSNTTLPPEGSTPVESGPTPTFTSPAPVPVESGPAENPANSSDFSAPGGFNWPDNQYASSNPNANNSMNIPNPTVGSLTEPAPSDLSHLVNASEEINPAGQEPAIPLAQPETLVPGGVGTGTEIPNVPTEETHKNFPKWIIGVGVGLLLAVAGASAYFILGIGKTPPPASIPATTTQENTIAPPVIQPTVVPTIAIPTASPSAGVSLPGGSGTQATSAADLLRQRQGR